MINIAIIGCGRISFKHIQAVVDNQDSLRLAAVCDVVKARAEDKAKDYYDKTKRNVPVYTDYKVMLEKADCDLAAICTESGYHAEIAIYCMNKEKHVIVEKPMALSTTDADKMIETADANHVKLCVCHQNRFNPSVQKLRQALEQGRFGRIIAGDARILWNREENYYRQAPWRGTYELDGGCLMNQCIHDIDLLQWMLGEDADWVHGEVGNYIHPYIEAEDYGSVQIKFKNGAIGNIEGTVCAFGENLKETLTVIGENGIASIGGLAANKMETWRFKEDSTEEDNMIKEYNEEIDSVYGNGHTPLYRDMIEAIRLDREPYINGPDGKKAVEIVLAAYRSAKEGRRIVFPVEEIASTDFK